MARKFQVAAVLGATATGKSDFAMELAGALGERGVAVELIGADALQAYRGFDIGTAKPGPQARAQVRHHLIDVLEPHQAYSAGEFARRSRAAVEDIERRGGLPMLVGGSGFYLRALFEGLAPVPPPPEEVRATLRSELRSQGMEALLEELRRVDPESAASLAASDTQRILRALEVARHTGRALSDWHRAGTELALDRRVLKIGLTLPRAVLYDAVAARAKRMLGNGWLEEVQRLRETLGRTACRDGRSWRELPAFQALGYRQLADHLDGRTTLEQALEETIAATRRYAKRQETWFRREPEVRWVDASDAADVARARERAVEALVRGPGAEAMA